MPEVTTVTNLVDLYTQQVLMAKNQFVTKAPFYHAIGSITRGEVVSQRGVRYAYGKTQPGGHGNPTLSQPDNNRAIPEQTDSMWSVPQWYTIPFEIDYSLLNDAGGARGPKKANAMFSIERLMKNITDVAAQRQEFYMCGNGSGALAYASATLTVPGAGQTLTCEIAAAAAPGHTKGAVRLKQNQYYQSWDTSTGLPEGTILVTSANNKTQATVTLLSGVVTSGNPITDVGSYNAVPMGITGLIDDNNRIVQGHDSAVDTIMSCPSIDLAGNKFTISDRDTIKTMLVTLNLEKGARSGLTNITTPGLMSDLRKQGYGQRRYDADEAVSDIAVIYKDGDGTRMMEIANYDEDRSTFFQDNLEKLTEFDFDDIAPDGLNWRNLPGVNATGSRNFYRFLGCSWTLGIDDFLTCSTVKRASLTGIVTQYQVGLGN